jgi:membrane protease subunit HflK
VSPTNRDDQPILPEPGPSHRHASVQLSGGPARAEEGPRLDPANQSLAEALNLVFKLLQVAMLGLVVYFALSGVQSVKENETGVRLVFGRPTGGELQPGAHFSWPFPLGELIKVDEAERTVDLRDSFWPQLMKGQEALSMEQLVAAQSGKYQLNPTVDGSLITGDQSLAHSQWTVRYHRGKPKEFVENVYDEQEPALVRATVERGIVQAVAQVGIDDFLKQSPGEQDGVAERAKGIAQGALDRMESGLVLDQLTIQVKTPPLYLMRDFDGVQAAEQTAGRQKIDAETQARATLNQMAGGAYEPLIRQIDLYEQAVAKDDRGEQERILRVIDGLLDGRTVEINGEPVQSQVAGKVTAILNEAKQYRSNIVRQTSTELETYRAKLAQFKTNPDVVLQRDWAEALVALLGRDNVEKFYFPPGDVEMIVGRDLDSQKAYEAARKAAKIKETDRQREKENQERKYKTDTNVQQLPTGG